MTIVEVVLALFLLGLATAGAYQLIVQSARLAKTARNDYAAITLAKNRLEKVRNLEYDDLYLAWESDLVIDDHGQPTSLGNFRRSTIITPDVEPGLTRIDVEVEIRNVRTGVFDGWKEHMSTKVPREWRPLADPE